MPVVGLRQRMGRLDRAQRREVRILDNDPPAHPDRRHQPVRRALVALGMTDLFAVSGRVVRALGPHLGETRLDVVVGSGAPSLEGLARLARSDRRIRVSDQGELSKSLVFYSGVSWFVAAGREEAFLELVRRTERQRGMGDWYGFLLVAQGSGEAMVEHGVNAWDVAGIQPIVEEAGGRFSNWDGGADIFKPDVLVSNGRLHDKVLAILAGKE